MKISVIVPVYNNEKYIRDCIDSILNQTFTDFELILVDDGSSDNSGVICDEYALNNSRIKVFHQKNRGVCAARNVGIDNAQGEYITFVDSDDYITNNALEVLYNDAVIHNADISCAEEHNCCYDTMQKDECKIWQGVDAIRNSLLDNAFTYSSCKKLYSREYVGEIRFEENKRIHEDSFFVFCCFLKKPTVVLRNTDIYYYRDNLDSASHSEFSHKFFDILYFADRKKEMAEKYFPELEAETKNMIVKANLAMLHALCNTNDKQYKKDIRNCIKTVKKFKKYFVPAIAGDEKFFFVVKNNLYTLFKLYYNVRYKHK